MLRVRTGQKALRAVGGRLFLNCGRAEKLTGWNTPPAVRKTKGLRNSREEPPHPRWRKEAGGGARGKLSPREATPSHPANRPRFLSKDFLRPDRRRALGPRREKAGRANLWLPGPLAVAAWPEHGECSPHTATSACSAPPSPQQD